jgi:PAS domain-containing protein
MRSATRFGGSTMTMNFRSLYPRSQDPGEVNSIRDGHVAEDEIVVRTRRFKRSGQPNGPADGPADSKEALMAELMLLREENAWLKAAQHQSPGIGRVIERARAIPQASPDGDELQDEAARILVEAHVLRESLLDVIAEIQQAMERVRAALEALPSGVADESDNGHRQEGALIDLSSAEGSS